MRPSDTSAKSGSLAKGGVTAQFTLPFDAAHFGFFSDKVVWCADRNGLWLDAVDQHPQLIPQSCGESGAGPGGPTNAVLWGKPGEGWILTKHAAWRHLGGVRVGPRVDVTDAAIQTGGCGQPPFSSMVAGSSWIAVAERNAVRVYRGRPPPDPQDLRTVLLERSAAASKHPWKTAIRGLEPNDFLGCSRLLATKDGRRFAVVTPVHTHFLSQPSGKPRALHHEASGHPESGALHPDGDLLAICERNLAVASATGNIYAVPAPLHRAAAFSDDGRYLVFCSAPESSPQMIELVAWDLIGDQARAIGLVPMGTHQARVEFSPTGKLLGIAGARVDIFEWKQVLAGWARLRPATAAVPRR